ncbi:unnamed protein product [Ilex paraguariensis]|uniref:F-box domain-containing protein n=1 Tax=Ilex paraguariensis TaxID=185542 RepID=A0ABC8RHG2_9AQUA
MSGEALKGEFSSGWAWLPRDLLDSILDKLVTLFDYFQFSIVCKPWFTVAKHRCLDTIHRKIPLLLLTPRSVEENIGCLVLINSRKHWLFSPHQFKGAQHKLRPKLVLSRPCINPLSGGTIQLPPIVKKFPEVGSAVVDGSLVFKAFLTADPILFPNDYTVVTLCGGWNTLAYVKSGDLSLDQRFLCDFKEGRRTLRFKIFKLQFSPLGRRQTGLRYGQDLQGSAFMAWLPEGLLDSILVKLVTFSDYVRFSVVCKPWHSVGMHRRLNTIHKKIPLLMLPPSTCKPWHSVGMHRRLNTIHKKIKKIPLLMLPPSTPTEEWRALYSVTVNKVYNFKVPSHGWLFTEVENMVLVLINPFSGGTIRLPPIETFAGIEHQKVEVDKIFKASLTADPILYPNDYTIVAIYGYWNDLAYIKSGRVIKLGHTLTYRNSL